MRFLYFSWEAGLVEIDSVPHWSLLPMRARWGSWLSVKERIRAPSLRWEEAGRMWCFIFFLFGRVLVGVVLRWNAGWTLGFGLRLVWATPDFLFLASVILCFVLSMSHCESLVAMLFEAQHQH